MTNGKHAKLKLSNGEKTWITANAWRLGDVCKDLKQGNKVDIVYSLDIDTWSGSNSLVMIVQDIKIN